MRFIEDILDEQSVGITNTQKQGDSHPDFLGYNDYTVLIEIKTSDTNFFTSQKTVHARANTWSFTPEFIEGVSQCLSQKCDWSEYSNIKEIVKIMENGERLILDESEVRTIDPPSIFIIGNKKKELPKKSKNVDIILKRDTLERFTRNNKNITILSFDELYDRAYYIVHGKIES